MSDIRSERRRRFHHGELAEPQSPEAVTSDESAVEPVVGPAPVEAPPSASSLTDGGVSLPAKNL